MTQTSPKFNLPDLPDLNDAEALLDSFDFGEPTSLGHSEVLPIPLSPKETESNSPDTTHDFSVSTADPWEPSVELASAVQMDWEVEPAIAGEEEADISISTVELTEQEVAIQELTPTSPLTLPSFTGQTGTASVSLPTFSPPSASSGTGSTSSLPTLTSPPFPTPRNEAQTSTVVNHPESSWWQGLGFRYKAVLLSLVLGVIPVAVLGTVNYNLINESLSQPFPTNGEANITKHQEELSNKVKGKLQLSLLLGVLITAGLVGVIAYVLADRNSKAIADLAKRTKQLGQSHLSRVSIDFTGEDELATIDTTVTALTQEIQTLQQEQNQTLQQTQLLSDLATSKLPDQSALEVAIQNSLDSARTLLGVDRIIFYYLPKYQSQCLVYTSVNSAYSITSLEEHPWLQEKFPQKFSEINNVATANIQGSHRQWLEQLQVKASLTVPLTRQEEMWGLITLHHCQRPHQWQNRERQFLQQLAEQFQVTLDRVALLQQRRESSKRAQILKDVTLKITSALHSEEVFDTAVTEIRRALKADRVIVYRFDMNWAGTIIAESVADQFPQALGANINDPCFAKNYVEKYREGRVQATSNIYEAGLTPCHLGQLAPFAVKANIVAPIIRQGELLGLLIAHQCSGPRDWEQGEIEFFSQLATQVGLALERTDLVQQLRSAETEQRQVREKLQKRAMELLIEVDPVSRGDLTIRAQVTEDEIGTIADSYNATIENLRRIVTQVQQAATQFADTTNTNEAAVRNLSEEAVRQAEDVAQALERLQAMSRSIQDVAINAEMAESAVQKATQTVDQGEDAMSRTVDGILAIRETVAATAKKVKRLGESSQKISKVVNLISSFADQTNLLALNAAIEAAHAGEEGRGFAVVADEVRSLARQSAEATAEISDLVASIQSETNEVVIAMETGTEQVVMGTKLVDETRKSLNQITAASAQISELVEAIAASALEQSQTSRTVTETMAQVAAVSDKTSSEAANVSNAFKELLAIAQSLQDGVRQFKVE
ncbi:MAG: methyl-accepting chemotaxis protein [Snowella sp.]|nr:methyl-accepting chemotaxis protein [Snowella sp.]